MRASVQVQRVQQSGRCQDVYHFLLPSFPKSYQNEWMNECLISLKFGILCSIFHLIWLDQAIMTIWHWIDWPVDAATYISLLTCRVLPKNIWSEGIWRLDWSWIGSGLDIQHESNEPLYTRTGKICMLLLTWLKVLTEDFLNEAFLRYRQRCRCTAHCRETVVRRPLRMTQLVEESYLNFVPTAGWQQCGSYL